MPAAAAVLQDAHTIVIVLKNFKFFHCNDGRRVARMQTTHRHYSSFNSNRSGTSETCLAQLTSHML
jgi:hypothetical protein